MFAFDVVLLVVGLAVSGHTSLLEDWTILVWLGILALVGVALAPVGSAGGPVLAMDLPVLLAAAFVYGPWVGGTIALVGSLEIRELRREVSASRALYNRAQTSLSVVAAALAFQALGGDAGTWPLALAAAALALVVDCAVNYPLAALASVLRLGQSFRAVVSSMKFGPMGVFVSAYLCFGLLGLLLAEVFLRVGGWGLVLAAVPVALARLVFDERYRLDLADAAIRTRRRATNLVTERIAQERRDERLALAGGLHDEVLPPLYSVHLLGQVLKRDLESCRLLDLEVDVAELLEVTERAQAAIRGLIRDLRKSPIGPGGLAQTLSLLVQELESETSAAIHQNIEQTGGSPLAQLLAYQVAREALRNAVHHADAQNIWVDVRREDLEIRVVVRDDGRGFDPATVDVEAHFGLELMRERLDAVGAILLLESGPGLGTLMAARVPAEHTFSENKH